MRRRGGDASRVSAWYLAVRRLASSSRLASLFLVAASVALAVFVASQAMVSSLRTTVDAKAKVFVGSDVRMQIGPDTQVPADLGFPATIATRSRQMGRFTDTDKQFDMVAIDPETFGSAAYWNDAVLRSVGARADATPQRWIRRPAPRRDGEPTRADPVRTGDPAADRADRCRRRGLERSGDLVRSAGVHGDRGAAARRLRGVAGPLHEAQTTREMWIRGPSPESWRRRRRRAWSHT